MAEPVVVGPGRGEVVGDTPARRVEILSEAGTLHATWSRFAPGRRGADLHVHRHHTDLFYVLEGELTLMLGPDGDEVALPAGTLARVPALVVHGFRNAGDDDVRYLNLHAPGRGFAAFLRAMRDGRPVGYDQEPPPSDGGLPATEAVVVADGPAVERPGARTVVLADVDAIAVAEVSLEPGGPVPAPHVHDAHDEALFVLEGTLALHGGGHEVRAEAGTWVRLEAGVEHAVTSGDTRPVRILVVHTPGAGPGAFLLGL